MRIIAGRLGGRTFDSPKGNRTHPMSDKIRGAIFNMLGDIKGLSVLDATAGSGALGIEAVSRDAAAVVAIEIDKNAANTIVKNIERLGVTNRVKVIRANASGWSDNNLDVRFDLVFYDPPYDQTQLPLLDKLARHLNPDGIMIVSLPPAARVGVPDGFMSVAEKSFGDAKIYAFRNVG